MLKDFYLKPNSSSTGRRRRRLREIEVMTKDELLIAIADRLPLMVVEDYERGLTWVQVAPKGWERENRIIDHAEFQRLVAGLPPTGANDELPPS